MGLLDDEEFLRSQMRATPRNQLLGLLSDVIAKGYSPERTQQMQGLSKFLGAQEVSQTLDRLSYGEPLTTGAGGIGGTTRVRPEALDAAMAAMNLAPLVGPTARVAGKAAMMAGKSGERFAERVVPQIMDRGGLAAQGLTPAPLPQQLALELAQQRAALPVSKGGLGLPSDNTAQQRAAAMGINVETNYIHSTNRPFNQITDDGNFSGIFTLPNYSSNYGLIDMPLVTGKKIATTQDLQNLIKNPTKKIQRAIDETIPLNLTDPADIADATVEMQKLRNQLAKKYGFDGVKISDEFGNDTVALVNPDNIRSRFAAFDPFRKTAATAALMGVAAPDLLASEITDEEKKRQLAGLLYP